MLSPIKTIETVEIPYAGNAIAGFPIITFNLENGVPFLLSSIGHTITAGPAILLSNFTIRDENGIIIYIIPIIPWQFAGTTITSTTMQSPNPSHVSIFATQEILGFISKELHIFNNWSISFTTLFNTPGDSVIALITLSKTNNG